ncbi:MAG TPA: YdcF family protein [Caulobacteraceae bacterium]|nr:YdcF family protein [Caulobacteraceae bacterium]
MRTLAALIVMLLVWTTGLMAFAARIDRSTPAPDPPVSDGVVALTGGQDARIAAAIGLLESGKATRMLISGVSREVTRGELQTLTGADQSLYDCCVDLGFTATSTTGNARETAQWAAARGYRTLILVTADYHMPRARLELRAAMPGETITPYPVATPAMQAGRWWRTRASADRMILEYSKYLAVLTRETVLGLGARPAARPRSAGA